MSGWLRATFEWLALFSSGIDPSYGRWSGGES
jgi:hypothetical protein